MASVRPQRVQYPLMRHGFYSLNREGCGRLKAGFQAAEIELDLRTTLT
jgi:hypothetical protein